MQCNPQPSQLSYGQIEHVRFAIGQLQPSTDVRERMGHRLIVGTLHLLLQLFQLIRIHLIAVILHADEVLAPAP